jgi:uncharacterized membrane protein
MCEIEKLRQEIRLDAKRFKWQVIAALIGAVVVAATLLATGAVFAKLFL